MNFPDFPIISQNVLHFVKITGCAHTTTRLPPWTAEWAVLQVACFILEIDLKMRGSLFGVPESNFLHFVKYPFGRPGKQAGGSVADHMIFTKFKKFYEI